jgi:hypothetical protein
MRSNMLQLARLTQHVVLPSTMATMCQFFPQRKEISFQNLMCQRIAPRREISFQSLVLAHRTPIAAAAM